MILTLTSESHPHTAYRLYWSVSHGNMSSHYFNSLKKCNQLTKKVILSVLPFFIATSQTYSFFLSPCTESLPLSLIRIHIKAGLWPLSLCPTWIMFMIKCVRKAPYQTCRITLLTAVLLLANVIPHSSCQRHGHQIFSINWDPYDDPCTLRMSVWNATELVSSPEISNGCETSLSHDSSGVSRNTHTLCSIGNVLYHWCYTTNSSNTLHDF